MTVVDQRLERVVRAEMRRLRRLRRPVAWAEEARAALVDLLAGERGLADRSQTPAITDLKEFPR